MKNHKRTGEGENRKGTNVRWISLDVSLNVGSTENLLGRTGRERERGRANRCSIFRARVLASHISPVPSTTPSLVIQVFKIGGQLDTTLPWHAFRKPHSRSSLFFTFLFLKKVFTCLLSFAIFQRNSAFFVAEN